MKKWLGFPIVQIVLCLGVYSVLAYKLGAEAAVWTSPLLGAAIARPLVNLLSAARHKLRARLWLPVHGTHYEFRGTTIRVLEDDELARWVNMEDVRKVVGATASDRLLAITYPDGWSDMGAPAQPYIRDTALVLHLSKVNEPMALRFRTWVDRNIAFPGRRIRERFGPPSR